MLGKKVKDKITGFEGIVVGRTIYLYGCDSYCVQPEINEKGEIPEAKWLDDGRLIIVDGGITPEEVRSPSDKPGGDHRMTPPNNRSW